MKGLGHIFLQRVKRGKQKLKKKKEKKAEAGSEGLKERFLLLK